MGSATSSDWQRPKSIPLKPLEKLVHALGLLGGMCLGLIILVCALFSSQTWEASEDGGLSAAGKPELAEPLYDIQINDTADAILIRSRHQVAIRDLRTGLLINVFPHLAESAQTVCWLPGSHRFLAGCQDGFLRILDSCDPHTELFASKAHQWNIRSSVISRDGGMAVTGSEDRVCLWDLNRLQVIRQIPMNGTAPSVLRFSPDETRLLIGSENGTVKIYRVPDLQREMELEKRASFVVAAAFLKEGRQVISGDILGEIVIHDVATGRVLRRFSPCEVQLIHMAVSPDERFLVFSDWTKSVQIYSLETLEKVAHLPAQSHAISKLRFTDQEGWLYAAGYDGAVRIWDGSTFAELCSFQATKPLD